VNLAGRGVNVISTYRSNQKEAGSLIREVEAMGSKAAGFRLATGDIHAFDGFVADVRKTLRGWGRDRFDYLVNNLGGSLYANFDQTTEAEFDEIVNVHFKGVCRATPKSNGASYPDECCPTQTAPMVNANPMPALRRNAFIRHSPPFHSSTHSVKYEARAVRRVG
jgi:hypothetical protein